MLLKKIKFKVDFFFSPLVCVEKGTVLYLNQQNNFFEIKGEDFLTRYDNNQKKEIFKNFDIVS